ncbi:hypothetical protein [Marinobacter sp. SS5-14b]|uniref:hypothetical protein n=1 Tax=Marinobacter sp. SS5-14b TaxID=3050456 RepID=UPI0026E11284|nr:hypothetical protein [Marinobacter sp. SS5-14b]
MLENVNLSASETEQLLRHALASPKRINSQRLALELDVTASRISEGLKGKWHLKPHQKEHLIEKYGQPRGVPGQYVFAEVADSISDFLDDEEAISRKRHVDHILNTLSDPDFLHQLARSITPLPTGVCELPTLKPAEVREKLSRFEKFLLSAEFSEWLEAVKRRYRRFDKEKPAPDDIEEFFWASTHVDIEFLDEIPVSGGRSDLPRNKGLEKKALGYGVGLGPQNLNTLDLVSVGAAFLLLQEEQCYQKAGLAKPLSLNNPPKRRDLVERVEFVLTGDLIREEQSEFKSAKLGLPFSEESIFKVPGNRPQQVISPTFERMGRLEFPSLSTCSNWDLDYWTTYRVRLFLSRDCNYSLVIELGNDQLSMVPAGFHHPLRTIVIPKISGRHVLDHLNALREWLGLDALPEQTIKEEIAQAGGYVPGARIL